MQIQLGNLEEMVLLLVFVMRDEEAYGVSIAEQYQKVTNKTISIPAIHTVLKRLEAKKLVNSVLGEPTQVRGGKKKRLYTITANGYEILKQLQEQRAYLWSLAPKFSAS